MGHYDFVHENQTNTDIMKQLEWLESRMGVVQLEFADLKVDAKNVRTLHGKRVVNAALKQVETEREKLKKNIKDTKVLLTKHDDGEQITWADLHGGRS